ncbi:hypothetical protein LR48_Vigan01g165400 [Vigna angularis]|uniref:Major facilitator superfamily (MFS) profile domain-containing protein n=2 Tax=Phaseolus angularis TaxID=3914 RepID=A0A0L9TND6_PHAAN|nr:uncharacterized protein LOC108338154 [Vigna angularis]KAG2408910.1 uncharacterized protein HKW66_Vig0037320 [Vigna angularis]KOM32098.1 hypothetical protein LR48_Vigan01g165400 [Vigna angularis]BAT75262.1 hypothetical protein VIGAN_01309600 [Vigna angularis var. angularis]
MKESDTEGGGALGQASVLAPPNGNSTETRSNYSYANEEVIGDEASKFEVWGWYLYEFCSYFVQTVLIPVVFPLLISQLQHLPMDPVQDWFKNHQGVVCSEKEINLYSTLTKRTITVNGSTFSSLEWTAIAWGGGLALAAPILALIFFYINGSFQTFITAAATGIGVLFCLPVGLFKTTKIFVLYIAMIVVAITVSTATHTHHLALMAPKVSRPSPLKRLTIFFTKQGLSSWISLFATVVGCLGACIVSSFTYHMLREPIERDFISLWIVTIFCGLLWLVGMLHVFTAENRTSSVPNIFPSRLQLFTIFKHPHAIGCLVSILLSSFTTMGVFTGGVLFIVGQLCIVPVHLLYFWLTYFLFPLFSLPLLFKPLQHLLKANSAKMKITGLLLSLISSGFGFYFWESHWKWGHLLVFGAIQGTSSGLLHTFGRVLMLETAPCGEEGGFSFWYGWVRGVGLFGGFVVGSVVPGSVRTSFGVAFCSALVGIVVLLFGNVSDFGAAKEVGERALDSKESISV